VEVVVVEVGGTVGWLVMRGSRRLRNRGDGRGDTGLHGLHGVHGVHGVPHITVGGQYRFTGALDMSSSLRLFFWPGRVVCYRRLILVPF
jgi:hypothetical protein